MHDTVHAAGIGSCSLGVAIGDSMAVDGADGFKFKGLTDSRCKRHHKREDRLVFFF